MSTKIMSAVSRIQLGWIMCAVLLGSLPAARGEMVAYWKFNEAQGSVASDSSAFGNSGTLYGHPSLMWADGKVVNGLKFDGTDDYVSCGNSSSLKLDGRSFSLSLWTKFDDMSRGMGLIGKTAGFGVNQSLALALLNPTKLRFGFYCNDLDASGPFAVGQWYHLVFTYDAVSRERRIYVNGRMAARDTSNGSLRDTDGARLEIGRNYTMNSTAMKGRIDEVRVYSHPLIEAEVKDLYESACLEGAWNFEETTYDAIDVSGNGNVGLLKGLGAPVRTEGKQGKGLWFDGNDNVNCGNRSYLNLDGRSFSISLWAKFDDMSRGMGLIGKTGGFGVNQSLHLMLLNPTNLRFGFYCNDLDAPGPFAVGQWYHLVFTYDAVSRERTIYVNGKYAARDTANGSLRDTNGGALEIGRVYSRDSEALKGSVDEVRIYSRPLTEAEVMDLHKSACLAGAWNFSEASGAASDGSGNGNTGLVMGGAIRTVGKQGNGLKLDGTDDYVDCGTKSYLNLDGGSFSLSMWAKFDDMSRGMGLIGKTGGFGVNQSLAITLLSPTKLRFGFYCNDLDASGPFAIGQWYHLVFTYDAVSKERKIYVNGNQVARDISNGSLRDTAGARLEIGRNYTWNSTAMKGAIDQVRIYSRALTAADVVLAYSSAPGVAYNLAPNATYNAAPSVPGMTYNLGPAAAGVDYTVTVEGTARETYTTTTSTNVNDSYFTGGSGTYVKRLSLFFANRYALKVQATTYGMSVEAKIYRIVVDANNKVTRIEPEVAGVSCSTDVYHPSAEDSLEVSLNSGEKYEVEMKLANSPYTPWGGWSLIGYTGYANVDEVQGEPDIFDDTITLEESPKNLGWIGVTFTPQHDGELSDFRYTVRSSDPSVSVVFSDTLASWTADDSAEILASISMMIMERWANAQGGYWNSQKWLVGDFNGDGKDDWVNIWNEGGYATIDLHPSSGTGFGWERWANKMGGLGDAQKWLAGDFNGDGKDDLANMFGDNGYLSIDVHPSGGSSFGWARWVTQKGGYWSDGYIVIAGDFNGDGKDDLAKIFNDSARGGRTAVDVHLSNGSTFGCERWLNFEGNSIAGQWIVGDFNGDGKEDLAHVFGEGPAASLAASIDIHISNQNRFDSDPNNWRWATQQGGYWDSQKWMAGDFNGDGMCDLAKSFYDNGNASSDVHLSDGNHGFAMERWATRQGGFWDPQKWGAGDFDGDGRCDMSKVFNGNNTAYIDVHRMGLGL
ncbi:MAG: LamG-like jellyroll fold domain-containing protein [bacterium]